MLQSSKNVKQCTLLAIDAALTLISVSIVIFLLQRTFSNESLLILLIVFFARTIFFIRWGMYRAVLRFSGIHALASLAGAMLIGTLIGGGAALFVAIHDIGGLGRAFLVLELLLSTALLGGSRIAVRLYYFTQSRQQNAERVCIYGAGALGEVTLRNLQNDGYRVMGYVDDDRAAKGRMIHGRRVLGAPENIAFFLKKNPVDILVVAIMHLPQPRLKEVFHICMENRIRMKVVHGMGRMLDNSNQLSVDDLSMEDLLHRQRRNLNRSVVEDMLRGCRVVITGAGGSIGSEICRQVAAAEAQTIIIIDHSEYNLYAIESELRELAPAGMEIIPVLATLLDRHALLKTFQRHRPELVYHAAAYKHVPLVESNPLSSILNNVQGIINLMDAADVVGVQRLVHISTDKAVRPTNIMGASKRVIELLLQGRAENSRHMCAVRFGNVLGSSGSVIPLFLQQIKNGGPVTVTDPEMTRYFMLIPEAVELVLQAGALANKGEIFILDMGLPVKIIDLAKQLIYRAGLIPDQEVKIVFTGLRPGEKMYEELLIDGAEKKTEVDGILITQPSTVDHEGIVKNVDALLAACREGDVDKALGYLRKVVPEWTSDENSIQEHRVVTAISD